MSWPCGRPDGTRCTLLVCAPKWEGIRMCVCVLGGSHDDRRERDRERKGHCSARTDRDRCRACAVHVQTTIAIVGGKIAHRCNRAFRCVGSSSGGDDANANC